MIRVDIYCVKDKRDIDIEIINTDETYTRHMVKCQLTCHR